MKVKIRKQEKSTMTAFVIGIIVAAIAEIVILMIFAAATSKEMIPESNIKMFATICALICSFSGAMVAAKKASEFKFPVAVSIGVSMFILNFALGKALPLSAEKFEFQIPLAFCIGAVLGGLLSIKKKKIKR